MGGDGSISYIPGKPLYENWRSIRTYRLPFRHTNALAARTLCEYAVFAVLCFFLVTILQVFKAFFVVQVNTLPDTLVFSTVLARLLGARVVVDMHELMPEMFRTMYRADAFHPIVRFLLWIERRVVRYCSHVFTVNASTERMLLERGVPRQKLSIVHNVPDGPRGEKTGEPAQYFHDGRLLLFYAGSILPRYDLDTLVKATALLQPDIPGVSLTIVGTGSAMGALEGLIIRLGLERRINLLGFVPFQQVPRLIATADICVATLKSDLYTDLMLPNKLFEWAAARKPIVAARLKAIEEFYGQDSLAYFAPEDEVSLASAILDLYRHPARARQLAENAFRKYYPVRWEQHKHHYTNQIANVGRRFKDQEFST